MSSTIECFGKIDKTKQQKLNKNSIFLLSYQNEDDEKKAERDFEFFVFVDPQKDEDRPDFLKVLYYYLIKDAFPDPKEKYINELKNWLKIDENNSLINPLNWLKIAIERYPYRLFVVIDSKKWMVNGHSPLEDNFWLYSYSQRSKPEKWKRSQFLYKRICWVDRNAFPAKPSEASEVRRNIFCLWLGHVKKIINKHNLTIYVNVERAENNGETTYIPVTMPNCFDISSTTSPNSDSCNGITYSNSLNFIDGAIIFNRHKKRKCFNNKALNKILYYEELSGSQFQLPLLSRKDDLNVFLEETETGCFKIAMFDERYVEWYEKFNGDKKADIFYTRIFPINKYVYRTKEFQIKGTDYCLKGDKPIKISSDSANSDVDIDILVIHQGIIDKLKDRGIPFDIMSLKDVIPFVIVTSGRGRPHDLPIGVKYVPFSSFEFFLMSGYPEKLLLVKTLMKAKESI